MKRRIFITEEIADKILKLNDIPEHLLSDVDSHKTSLGDNPCFPLAGEISYEHSAAIKRWGELRKQFDESLDVAGQEKLLSEVSTRIEEIESGNEHILEKLCFNIVNKLFAIPAGLVTFKCHIQPNLEGLDRVVHAKSEDTPGMKFKNTAQIKELRDEVFKRRTINALIMGAALTYSNLPKEFVGDVYEIDPELPKLYKQYNLLNNLLLFEKPTEITEDNKQQGGLVRVNLGNGIKRTAIEAYGKNFPILLCESIRGFMELFASHGLPEEKSEAEFVMKKADFLAAEPWDMRLGPVMWKSLVSAIGGVESTFLPSIFMKLTSLPATDFFHIMSEILAETEEGDEIMSSIAEEAKHDIDYDDFCDTLAQKNMDKNMIADEYLSESDLDMF